MTYLLSNVEVTGFWGNHDFKCKINPDVTFFIGQNGTGKTTFINLIAASLNVDFPELDTLDFKEIKISFSQKGSRSKGFVLVKKNKTTKRRSLHSITYEIKHPNQEKAESYALDEYEDHIFFSDFRFRERHYREYLKHHQPAAKRKLKELFDISWLTINRASATENLKDERNHRNTVDQKVELLGNELIKYFSSLTRQKELENEVKETEEKLASEK